MQEELKDIANAIENFEALGHDDIYGFTANGNLGQIAYNLDRITKELENISSILMTHLKTK